MAAPNAGDPGFGDALLTQLTASIDEEGMMTEQHREIAAALRRHLFERAAMVVEEAVALPPRFDRRLDVVRAAVHATASRGAAIEDAIGHALVTGGLLGDHERIIIRRMLATIRVDLDAIESELEDVTLDAAWVDHGGPG
ncbi:MAG: hypothetical protein RIF41_24860 [Polyangiaceae bacterium]